MLHAILTKSRAERSLNAESSLVIHVSILTPSSCGSRLELYRPQTSMLARRAAAKLTYIPRLDDHSTRGIGNPRPGSSIKIMCIYFHSCPPV